MKNKAENSNSVDKSLKVVITNQPTKEKAKEIIKKISDKMNESLSGELIELEENL